jgi:putative hydroxymethylpyrimidine transport system substrate-binding protein
MTRRFAVVACSIAAVLAMTGCGERDETLSPGPGKLLRVAMPPLNGGEGAVYSAQASGEFQEAGVKARLSQYPDAATAIRAVQTGRADLAVGTEPDLLEARGRGARVVSVAALVQSPFTSLIAPRPSPLLRQPALTITPIGTSGLDYQRAFAETIFQKEGRRARVVDVGNDLAGALQRKKVAAVIAPFGGPPLPGGVVPVPVDRIGVPTFSEYVLVANQDALARDRDAIRSFIGALARGTRNLGALKEGPIARFLQGREAANIRRLMLPSRGKPYGWQDAAKWRQFADWMRENKLPQKGATGAFTNELLPGQGL